MTLKMIIKKFYLKYCIFQVFHKFRAIVFIAGVEHYVILLTAATDQSNAILVICNTLQHYSQFKFI